LVALAVAVVLAMYLIGLPGPLAILSLVPTLVLLFALGWAMALLGGLTTVLFRDAEYIANVGFQILFYATPIIYTDDALRTHRLEFLMYLNPLVAFLQLLRTPIIKGCLPDASSYAIACGTVLVLAGGATFFLRSIQRKFIFYL
jgi:ABC-type polysaccharide/polyol phosphate export permease